MPTEIKTFTGFIGEENTKGFDELVTLLDNKLNKYLASYESPVKYEVTSNIVLNLPSTSNRTEGLLYQIVVRYSRT